MGISVDMFVKTYKANSKAKDKTFEDFMKKHITTSYIPFMNKVAICGSIAKVTCHVKEGEREFIRFDSPTRYLIFVMKLIENYTDIEVGTDNVAEQYDKLNEVGAINTLINYIPEAEYAEFSTILNMKMDDLRDNEYSTTALFYNLREELRISEEVLNSVIDKLKEE